MLKHKKTLIVEFVNWLFRRHNMTPIDEGYLEEMIKEFEEEKK